MIETNTAEAPAAAAASCLHRQKEVKKEEEEEEVKEENALSFPASSSSSAVGRSANHPISSHLCSFLRSRCIFLSFPPGIERGRERRESVHYCPEQQQQKVK